MKLTREAPIRVEFRKIISHRFDENTTIFLTFQVASFCLREETLTSKGKDPRCSIPKQLDVLLD
jgi:hypothetical protein